VCWLLSCVSLIEMAQEARKAAMEKGQVSAAVAAIKEIGILFGIRVERSESGRPREFDGVSTELSSLDTPNASPASAFRKNSAATASRCS
jgi:hypothetical protein